MPIESFSLAHKECPQSGDNDESEDRGEDIAVDEKTV